MIKGTKQFKEYNDLPKAYGKEYVPFSYKPPKADLEFGDIYGDLGHEEEEAGYSKSEAPKPDNKDRRIKGNKEKKIKEALQKSAKRIVKTLAMTVATATSVVTISVTSNGAVFPEVANWARDVGEQLNRPLVETTTKPLTLEQLAKAWEEGAEVVIAEMNGEDIPDKPDSDKDGEYYGDGEETGAPEEEVVEELPMSDENESESETEPETTEAESSSEETSEEETLPSSTEETTEESTEASTEASSEESSTEAETTTTAAPRPRPTSAPTEAPTEPTEPTSEESECEHDGMELMAEKHTPTDEDVCTELYYVADVYCCPDCGANIKYEEGKGFTEIDMPEDAMEPGPHRMTVEPLVEDDGSLNTVNIYCANDGCPTMPYSKPEVVRATFVRTGDTGGTVSITINGGSSGGYTITEISDGGTVLDFSGSATSVTVTGIPAETERLMVIVETPYMFSGGWSDITFHLPVV